MVCVVGRMRDLILQLSKSSIYSTKPASGRTTAQDGFTFSIISGTTNGTTAVTDYSTLPEGIWSGDVSVQFDATWTS